MLMYDTTLTDLDYDQPAECPHENTMYSGHQPWWNEAGLREWLDDPQLICLDCGMEVIDVQQRQLN